MNLPEDTFEGLSKLKLLTLSDNSLMKLPDNLFSPLISLEVLNLRSNKIEEVPSSLQFTNIMDLDVSTNTISDVELFTGIKSLRRVDSSDNALTMCTCKIVKWMLEVKADDVIVDCISTHNKKIYTSSNQTVSTKGFFEINEAANNGCACAVNPCKSDGKCIVTNVTDFKCKCNSSYEGEKCEKLKGE